MSKLATTLYLVLYNGACMALWGWTLFLALEAVYDNWQYGYTWDKGLGKVWEAASAPMIIAQWGMCMEILHAVTGLVPSPAHVVLLQVFSRVFVLAAAQNFRVVTNQWACGLMIISWSLVEVPRYAFYIFAKLGPPGPKGTPYFIFFLRYSLFFILYPTGITGEVLTLMNALPHLRPYTLGYTHMASTVKMYGYPISAAWIMFTIKFVLWTYLPGGPFMYMNMVSNRKNAFSKRNPPPARPETGTVFPLDGSPEGTRTTTETSKRIIEAALRGAGGNDANKAADKVKAEKKWRFKYNKHYEMLVRSGVSSKAAATGSAIAGLAWIYDNFEFIKGDKVMKFKDALAVPIEKTPFHTGVIKGTGKGTTTDISYRVPYDGGWHPSSPKAPADSSVLVGEALKKQLNTWVQKGVMEQDAASAVAWTLDYFGSKHDLSHCYFVMIGAGSAMGPFAKLLECGANVVALDIPGKWGSPSRPTIWKRLVAEARKSRGSIIFPISTPQGDCKDDDALCAAAGADLTQQPFDIADWLVKWAQTIPADAPVVIGNYTYLDGDMHVKLSLCADVLIQSLRKARPSCAVAFLCTPTDLHVVPEKVALAAKAAYGSGLGSFGVEMLINILSRGKMLKKNYLPPAKYTEGSTSGNVHLIDGLSVAQGPNYALAKRMQHWRAVIEYEAGATVSSMVAPSTATISVLSNRTFAWAYGGMPYFGYEVFKQETTNAIMASILIHDLLNPKSPKNPKNREAMGIRSALELFSTESVHGGLWRSPYKIDSIGEVSALIYFAGEAKLYALLAALAGAGFEYARRTGLIKV